MLEENPRRRRRARKNPSGKRRKKARAKKVTIATTVRSNPRRRRRRSASSAPSMRVARRRRRSNPGGESWAALGAQTLGGMAAAGVEWGLAKIPQLTGYYFLAADTVAPFLLGVGAVYAKMPNVGRGLVGVGGYKIVRNGMAGYALYQATSKQGPNDGKKGLGSIRSLPLPSAVDQGFGSIRMGAMRPR